MSLDGYVAKPDGNIDWLTGFPNPRNLDFGYAEFLAGIDTTLMGHKTYTQVLGFDLPFPYSDKKNYVFTRTDSRPPAEFVNFVSGDIPGFVLELKQQTGGDIWLIGGGQINGLMIEAELIDELIIHVIPLVLGSGIPMFDARASFERTFTLTETKPWYNGIVELRYKFVHSVACHT